MTGYRRNFVAGGSFFTVNLAERRLRLLTGHIDQLRTAFREVRRRHPFTIDARCASGGRAPKGFSPARDSGSARPRYDAKRHQWWITLTLIRSTGSDHRAKATQIEYCKSGRLLDIFSLSINRFAFRRSGVSRPSTCLP